MCAQALAQLAAAAHEHLLGMQYGMTVEEDLPQQQQQALVGGRLLQEARTSSSGRAGAHAADAASEGAAAAPSSAAAGRGGSSSGAGPQQQPLLRYDGEMEAVRSTIEKVVLELVAGLKSSPDIKRGLLSHAGQLGVFFGRRATTDQLLPPLYTCLNDHVEWRLRSSFYGAIAALGPHTGHLDIFMLPYLEQVRGRCVVGRGVWADRLIDRQTHRQAACTILDLPTCWLGRGSAIGWPWATLHAQGRQRQCLFDMQLDVLPAHRRSCG